jgi:pyrroline-5-carboxylate reductase
MAIRAKTIDIGFIGGGNMTEALVRGLVASGRAAATMLVAEPDAARRVLLSDRYAVATTDSNDDVVRSCSTIVLAVKPQVVADVMAGLLPSVCDELFVSIAAGVMLARLEAGFGGNARVVRVMPNTPSLVGKGASVICAGSKATTDDVELVRGLFAAVGDAHVVGDENLMHLVTAVSGSGPAYVYRFAEGMIEAATRGGMDAALAHSLVYQTIAGAAAMMIETGQPPADLRRAVSSPGGTTLAGLARLDERGLVETMCDAVEAAASRSVELAKA